MIKILPKQFTPNKNGLMTDRLSLTAQRIKRKKRREGSSINMQLNNVVVVLMVMVVLCDVQRSEALYFMGKQGQSCFAGLSFSPALLSLSFPTDYINRSLFNKQTLINNQQCSLFGSKSQLQSEHTDK